MSTFVSQETGDATTAGTIQNFYAEKHAAYVTKIANDTSSFEFVVSQHFRMSGVYWGLTALSVLGIDIKKEMDMVPLLEWLMNCQDPISGGYVIHTIDISPHGFFLLMLCISYFLLIGSFWNAGLVGVWTMIHTFCIRLVHFKSWH